MYTKSEKEVLLFLSDNNRHQLPMTKNGKTMVRHQNAFFSLKEKGLTDFNVHRNWVLTVIGWTVVSNLNY